MSNTKSRLRRYNLDTSSQEPTSSDEPASSEESSSEEPIMNTLPADASKILWVSNTAWHTWTEQLGYPRPQGNIPMLLKLTPQKQDSLLRAYFSVRGDSADYANNEWMPYQKTDQA
jgi:hypothetical protein